MEPVFTRQQLVDTMKVYYTESRENPENFNFDPETAFSDEAAEKSVDYLLSKI